jgi:NADH-quinone oxidoreductase subunit M
MPTLPDPALLLSLIIFLPTAAALVLLFLPKRQEEAMKQFSLIVTVIVFLLTVLIAIPGKSGFDLAAKQMQHVVFRPWIESFKIDYFLGIDGISFPLVILTSFLGVLAMWASWPITKHVKAYCILFLLLETGMLGVFMALDFFLFYVFWEVMLLPMYFLIGVWGGPRREYAAIKFFLFTLVGSVLMLIAILMLYYASDLNAKDPSGAPLLSAQQLAAAHVPADRVGPNHPGPAHTFNILALTAIGQAKDSPFVHTVLWGQRLGTWAFLLLFIGFVIKLPAVPVHTWLPDAHVEAPTPISMILAGVLLKMGGYGVLRICYPICPQAAYNLAWFVCGIGVLSMVYGAFAAMAQKDFKRLVAYSSVSHMGYVLLGIGLWSAAVGGEYLTDYWKMGVSGAMFQMIAHGISSAGMFFLVGVVYDRVHHRNIEQFGGLFQKMPVYGGISMVIFFAALGLPGLCGFIGEVLVVLASWSYSKTLAVLSASVVILTAGYILWTIQRVFLGPEYKGPHGEALSPMTRREIAIAAPLVALAIVLGVYPMALLKYVNPSTDHLVDSLTTWTKAEQSGPSKARRADVGAGQAVPDAPRASAQSYAPPRGIEVTTPDTPAYEDPLRPIETQVVKGSVQLKGPLALEGLPPSKENSQP